MKTRHIVLSLCAFFVFAVSSVVMAQTCKEGRKQTAPTSSYSILESDERVVIDNGFKRKATRWMRCAIGQEWDGKSCTGEPTLFTWMEVHQLAAKYNEEKYAGLNQWRVPFLPELMTLRETACQDPAMNTEIFVGAPSVFFWTSMPAVDDLDNLLFSREEAYGTDFITGAFVREKVSRKGAVRLIHDGPEGTAWANPFAGGQQAKQEQ